MTRLLPLLLMLFPALAAEPRTELSVVVPERETSALGELTAVTVPGGGILWVEQGRPQVPYYTAWFGYPADCRIQAVTLLDRSGAQVDSGLQLPLVHFSSYNDPVPDLKPKPGLYPPEEFSWRVIEATGDSATLALTVYPYRFDPVTGTGTFHRQFDFAVRYVRSGFGIASVTPADPVCDPGDKFRAVVRFSGEAATAKLRPKVLDAQTRAPVAQLAEVTPGTADSVVIEWPTRGQAAGSYLLELVLANPAGNELDRDRAFFRIGRPDGEISDFEVKPRHFDIGDDIQLVLTFRNTGSVPLDGKCVFRINRDGEQVDQLEQEMDDLKPGAGRTFRESWSTDSAQELAVYTAVGFVRFEGTASDSRSAWFSTNLMPAAAFELSPDTVRVGENVAFDAAAAKDEDGRVAEYRWDFGDGGKGEGVTVNHRYMQPGVFTVRLEVVDNEEGTGTAERVVPVFE